LSGHCQTHLRQSKAGLLTTWVKTFYIINHPTESIRKREEIRMATNTNLLYNKSSVMIAILWTNSIRQWRWHFAMSRWRQLGRRLFWASHKKNTNLLTSFPNYMHVQFQL